MATRQITECDVFGTVKNLKVVVVKIEIDGRVAHELGPQDMSPRALVRLRKFVRNGITPPGTTNTGE